MTTQTTEDAFLGERLIIEQPRRGYRAGLDAVLLAATVDGGSGRAGCDRGPDSLRVLDVGAGVGTVGLCIAARLVDARVVLLEREPELVEIARRNVSRNGFEDRVSIAFATVGGTGDELARAGLSEACFDVAVANPPYHSEDGGTAAPHPLKAASHAMPSDALDTWLRFMVRMVRPGGHAILVHKASAVADVLWAMRGRFGAIVVLPIHPRTGASATRVLVRGTKGSRASSTLREGLVLHGPGNTFLAQADAILRAGAYLPLGPVQDGARVGLEAE